MTTIKRHRTRSWMAALLTVAIAVAASGGILFLRHRADSLRQSQVILGQLEAAASRQTVEMMSVLGSTVASGRSADEILAMSVADAADEIEELQKEFAGGVLQLERNGVAPQTGAAITELERLQVDLETGVRLLRAGDYADAYIYGLRRTKPTYEKVERTLAVATAELGLQAVEGRRLGDAGGIATMIAAVGLILFLRRRMQGERHSFQMKLQHEALHDPLTDLPNRRLFRDRVDVACKRRSRGHGAALLFIDLDGFKGINDTFGHDAGDRALQLVSDSLLDCVRQGDTVARIGGDEFAVLVLDVKRPVEAAGLAGRILERLDQAFLSSGQTAGLGASVGIAVASPGEDAEQLCARADEAMYQAKRGGKGAYRIAPPPGESAVSDPPSHQILLTA